LALVDQILDGYASPLTMSELWGYRDDRLANYLKESGFYIASSAASNYDRTEFSLASSLNMQYLNNLVKLDGKSDTKLDHRTGLKLEDKPGLKSHTKPSAYVFMRLVQDSQLVKLLHRSGYHFIQVASGGFGTDGIPQADQVVRVNYVNHFSRALAYLTPWSEIEPYCPVLSAFMAQTRLAPGAVLGALTGSPSPKFVLIHTDLPHAPYLFDEYGKQLKLPPGLIPDWQPPERYFGQWKFCQSQLITWIGGIMKASAGRAIIIVQSDHGPGIRMKEPQGSNQTEGNNWYNERMRIFNAYYLPGNGRQSGLYEKITPVNSWRLVLNNYFKADLPMLKDISYCPADPANTFDWQNVTGLLKLPQSEKTKREHAQ
jgi:hypothetical protein